MKTGKKLLTGTLLAICTALLVLCSVLAIGWSKAAKTGDALPEVRNNGTAIQWKYSDEADWHTLWRLPSCVVLPEKTERTAQTVKTALMVPTVRTE
uniref:hypothetical protein n=1 Tax=Ruminococcus bicirculans (ex Wegman et al. 2014) TaxID=1160721 RepID=UPI003FD7306E